MVLAIALKRGFVFGSLALFIFISPAVAQYKNERYASLERSKDAVGHYARARAMLVRALQEFEEGRKLALPDLLLDSEEWRLSIISRAEELNRVLDPQPKVVRSGTRFSASPLQVERKKQQLPPLEIGPADNNTQGEEERARQKEIEAVKARMSEVSKDYDYASKPENDEPGYLALEPVEEFPKLDPAPIKNTEPAVQANDTAKESGLSLGDIIPSDLSIPEVESEKSAQTPEKIPTLFGANEPAKKEVEEVKKTETEEVNAETNYDDDAAVSQAIERSIKERLSKINGGGN